MKIIHINAVFGIKSTGTNTEDLVNYAISKGHDSFAIYGQLKNNKPNSIYWGNRLDHKIHGLISKITCGFAHGSVISTFKLIQFLKQENPNIVHIQDVHANYINLDILIQYLAKHNVPTVITLHDCWYFTGGCMHYTTNQCLKWKTACTECAFVQQNFISKFINSPQKELCRKIRLFNSIPRLAVIGVSDWITSEAKQSPVFKSAKIVKRIYNWVDTKCFNPKGEESEKQIRERHNLKGKYMLLGVSNAWIPSKGLNDWIKLAENLGSEYDIILIGKEPTCSNLPSNIHATGSIYDKQELARYYSAASVFIHLSWEETFGKVSAEAMACGTPIIVYNSTASPELVIETTGCVIKQKSNIDNIATKVRSICNKGKKFYSNSCINRVKELFDINNNCQSHLILYSNLIKE